MKLMIAADIHGSAYYCKKMLEAFHSEQSEKLLILGDVLYHGPRNDLPRDYSPKAVIAMLNELKDRIFCVKGNCDSQVDQMVLTFPILADYCLLSVGSRLIYASHGHQDFPPIQAGDILLAGHTHIPAWKDLGNNNLYLNPGSVSIPKDGSRPGYMVLHGDLIEWKTFDGIAYHSITLS